MDDEMILEVAILDIKPGEETDFQNAFDKAQAILRGAEGYVSHQLQRCVERKSRYLLLVNWETLEHHTEGFRGSPAYQQWRSFLHHFYEPFPNVEHYSPIAGHVTS